MVTVSVGNDPHGRVTQSSHMI